MPILQQPIRRPSAVNQQSTVVTATVNPQPVRQALQEPNLTKQEKDIIASAEVQYKEMKKSQKLKNPGGRPTEVTSIVVLKLVGAFQSGMNVETACQYAGISRATLYRKLKEDQEFRDIIMDAKDYLKISAGDRLKTIIQKGSDRDAAPLVKWYLEKSIPELYGNDKIEQQNNTQNNIYVLDNNQLSNIRQQSDVSKTSPAKLLEALETRSELDTRGEEGSTASLRDEEVQGEYSENSDMPQSSSPI